MITDVETLSKIWERGLKHMHSWHMVLVYATAM